jgi:aminopeptidase N
MLRGIQEHFRHHTVTTEDITGYFKEASGTDYTWFFDQYLRSPSIPILLLDEEEDGNSLKIKYRWQADAHGFCMPVKLTASKDKFTLVYPTMEWQTMELKEMNKSDLKVDTENFYIEVRRTGPK